MIGAEIVALVLIVFGGGYGFTWLAVRYRERIALEKDKRAAMRSVIENGNHEKIDAFLALWGSRLTKDERAMMERIREDRYVREEA